MCSSNMDDLEQECEDAVFEVCDARERYPIRCVNELTHCIKLENEICLEPVKNTPCTKIDASPMTKEQLFFLENLGVGSKKEVASMEGRHKKMASLLNKMENLGMTVEQIGREKYEETNNLLRN